MLEKIMTIPFPLHNGARASQVFEPGSSFEIPAAALRVWNDKEKNSGYSNTASAGLLVLL